MDMNNIRAFVAVAEKKSFSAAAEELYVTQPAISKRVANLENSLCIKLFDRISKHIVLTEAGKIILPKCRLILDTVNDATTVIHNLTGEVTGNLSIGTSHHIGLHHIPPVLRHYVQQYPKVELDLHFLSSEQVCDKITTGEIELGIITLPTQTPEHLITNPLWHDPMQLVVSKQHPLAQLTKCNFEKLMAFNAILPERGTYTYTMIATALEKHGAKLRSKISTNYLETIKMMVSVGLGWSILPETLIDKDLRVIRLPNVSFSRTLGTVQHKQRTLSNAAMAMISLLEK